MNSRRLLIVLGLFGVLHNALRAIAAVLGAPSGFLNYLRPFHARVNNETIALVAGVVAIVVFAAVLGRKLWHKAAAPSAMCSSSLWAVGSGAALGLLATYVSTVADKSYGLWLFVLLPFLMGYTAVVAFTWMQPATTLGQAFSVAVLSVLTLGGILLLCAIEGVVCLMMALPLAIPLAIIGGALAYTIHGRTASHSPATLLLLIGLTPFGATLEHTVQGSAELFSVTTSIDIRSSPERVWRTVLQPAKLAPPAHALFRAGIAYPLASHIEGAGLSATRYCDFSTGKLVEPVLIWDEGKQLRFTVVSNPLPMQEWTPYAQVHPPHLEGFLASRQGEFRLVPLADGSTRLLATTWYQHHMWPASYWRIWSDYIIHQVHGMVLENIRSRAES